MTKPLSDKLVQTLISGIYCINYIFFCKIKILSYKDDRIKDYLKDFVKKIAFLILCFIIIIFLNTVNFIVLLSF